MSLKTSEGANLSQCWVFLAMAHHKKGNDDEDPRWLEKVRIFVTGKPEFGIDFVETRFLLKEAETVLRENPPARP
jgi:hypothetical protein